MPCKYCDGKSVALSDSVQACAVVGHSLIRAVCVFGFAFLAYIGHTTVVLISIPNVNVN